MYSTWLRKKRFTKINNGLGIFTVKFDEYFGVGSAFSEWKLIRFFSKVLKMYKVHAGKSIWDFNYITLGKPVCVQSVTTLSWIHNII